jgi:hypothetical protein
MNVLLSSFLIVMVITIYFSAMGGNVKWGLVIYWFVLAGGFSGEVVIVVAVRVIRRFARAQTHQ